MKLCRYLRWKAFYDAVFPTRSHVVAALQSHDAPCHCLLTCQSWGEDDALVAPELCQPGRACFQLSARDPDANVVT